MRIDSGTFSAMTRRWARFSAIRPQLPRQRTIEILCLSAGVRWNVDPERSTQRGVSLLPSMNTDIALESEDDRLIIDCKFYRDAFSDITKRRSLFPNISINFRLPQESVYPAGTGGGARMLLYPTVAAPFDEHVSIDGHEIRVVSINLGQDWQRVSEDLLSLLAPRANATAQR